MIGYKWDSSGRIGKAVGLCFTVARKEEGAKTRRMVELVRDANNSPIIPERDKLRQKLIALVGLPLDITVTEQKILLVGTFQL